MTTQHAPEHTPQGPDDDGRYLTDRQRAFQRYKDGVKAHGKPFFPYGVYHDLVAATVVMAIIIGLTVVWFAQANCDSWYNVSCDTAATPAQQEQYHPGKPTKVVLDEQGHPEEGLDAPLLGPLYEEKADPATTSYHPRPEWYFYFLFYLLIVFSNPQTVVLGTIIVPTIWLVLLLAWPFLDRKTERRPSRRPIAMAAMSASAVVLLAFTYYGSKAGEETGPEGLTSAQLEMPGAQLIFEDQRGELCFGCHIIARGSNTVGPDLTEEGNLNRGIDWQIRHLVDPKSEVPGSNMPAEGGADWTEEEIAQIAAFLETLGQPDRAEDPEYAEAGQAQYDAAMGNEAGGAKREPGDDTDREGASGSGKGGDTES